MMVETTGFFIHVGVGHNPHGVVDDSSANDGNEERANDLQPHFKRRNKIE